jgi:hypothetical protein
MTREGWWVFIGVALVLATTCGRCVAGAQRQPDDDVLQLSRFIVSEAGYRPGEESWAILHTLEWRRTHLPAFAGLDIVQMGMRYCSEFNGRSRSVRSGVSRHLRLQDIPVPVQNQVRDWVAGRRRESPCPGAQHWRSLRGVEARWQRFRIRCRVQVQNAYFGGEP